MKRFTPEHVSRRLAQRRRHQIERQLRDDGWYDPAARSGIDAVFVGGCGRSGTTVFKEVLNRHPRLACGPETSLFGLPFNIDNMAAPWGIDRDELAAMQQDSPNLVGFAERFAARFLAETGKQRWVEKTPNNVRAIGPMLTWFPNCRFIHLIRDGRDVACSLRHHPKERVVDGRIVPVHSNNPVEKSATRWRDDTAGGLAYRSHPRVLEVRYEALVSRPAETFTRVCEFIGERFDPAILDPSDAAPERPGQNMNNPGAGSGITPKSVGRWKKDLSAEERRRFFDTAGELLIALGYASDDAWVTDPDA